MILEYSAGGVVFKKVENELYILVAQHSKHHGWVFPKGFIGDKIAGENKEETALREVTEETGIDGKILHALTPVTYEYTMNGEHRKKTVFYYIMSFVGGDIRHHDWEMENVEWLLANDVEKRLTYSSDKQVWNEAKKKIFEVIEHGGIA